MTIQIIKPADRSRESIKDVVCIVVIKDNKGMGFITTKHISLEGSIAEKLQQYFDAIGVEWNGFNEQVFTTFKQEEPTSLNLGAEAPTLVPCNNEVTKEAQKKIDALTLEAEQLLAENEWYKQQWAKKKIAPRSPELVNNKI